VIGIRDIARHGQLSELYRYQTEGLGEIPDELIKYREKEEAFDTGFDRVAAFNLCSDGHIYAAGDQEMRVFDKNGTLLDDIALPAEPTAIRAAQDGRIYIGVGDHVIIYDSQMELVDTWQPASDRSLITSIEVYGDNVFLADSGDRVVRRYDREGNFVNVIGRRDDDRNVPGIVLPTKPCLAIAMAEDGLLRVNNPGRHRIEAYTFRGDLEWWWGRASNAVDGFCGCCNPSDFAMLPGDGYVTSEKSLIRIKIYDAYGELESVVAGPDQLAPGSVELLGQRSPELDASGFKVEVDNDGLIYVLDPLQRKVRVFQREKQ